VLFVILGLLVIRKKILFFFRENVDDILDILDDVKERTKVKLYPKVELEQSREEVEV